MMFKVLIWRSCQKAFGLSANNNVSCRTLLTDAYKCTTSWNNRLASPILQKVNPDELYYDIENNFGPNGKATAIDVDIYANSVNNVDYLDSLADLLHKLRLSRETSNTLDSTSHAVVRIFHEFGEHEDLLKILNDRINYGIFLDTFTANLLLDHFIESNDYTSAAKVSTMLMLQEDFSNAISKFLSLKACLQYIQDPKSFEPETEEKVGTEEVKPQSKRKKDEKRVRVKFLRNPYFDDHFDLRDGNKLVGKTLYMIGQNLEPGLLRNSCSLLGLVMYRKFEKAQKFIETIDKKIFDEARDHINVVLNSVKDGDSDLCHSDALKMSLEQFSGEPGLYQCVDNLLKDVLKTQEPLDIAEQIELHENWIKIRENKLQEQLDRFHKAKTIAEAEAKLKDLEEEERRLWFFENEEQFDLDIENKRVYYPKKWFGKKKKPRAIDEDYVPPEVQKEYS